MLERYSIAALVLALVAGLARAQEPLDLPPPTNERLFGFEFEFAGKHDRIIDFEQMPWENYERLMRVVVEHYGGNASEIRRVDFMKETGNLEKFPTGERPLFRAEWTDAKGRNWKIEPEYVQSTGLDGYEMVTPPLDDPKDLRQLIDKIAASGLVKEGLKSGVHLNLDGRSLVRGNNAQALANLILMHESYEPLLRRMFRPVRGGGPNNRFARSIAVDHEELLREIDALPAEERTREKLEELFRQREAREAQLHEAEVRGEGDWTKLWKYRSLNLAKVLQINELHNGKAGVVEFRMFDLDVFKNPAAHELQAEIYRAMVRQAEMMAERGETFRYRPRSAAPEGADMVVYNTPKDPAEAKTAAAEMLRTMGLDPANYTEYLDRTFVREVLPSRTGITEVLGQLTDAKLIHNGKPFTYGFEYEGRGSDVVKIMVPTDGEARANWDSKTVAEKKAYYRSTVGDRPSTVDSYFEPDTRLWWLDPYWYTEGTGNWEIHSKVFDNLEEAMRAMREAKKLAGASGKGFHLHMRDNGPDWEMLEQRGSQFADFIERASDWVWLQRARRLKTMIGVKSWSNARMSPGHVENLAKLQSSSRATIRTQVSRSENYIDVEIRGLTKWVDDIELLAKLISNGLVTGNFGEWKHTDNLYRGNTKGENAVNFTEFMEDYVREVEGKTLTPTERKVYDRLQHDYLKASDSGSRLSATQLNVATPLQSWHMDQALDPYLRRDLYFRQQDYARSLRFTLNKVMNGHYGVDLDVLSPEGFERTMGLDTELAEKLVTARELRGGTLGMDNILRMVASGDPEKVSRLAEIELESTDRVLGERLGLDAEGVAKLRAHAQAVDITDALERAGVEEARLLAAIDRSGVLDVNAVEGQELHRRLGLTPTETERLLAYRDAHEVTSEEAMRKAGVSEAGVELLMEAATRTVDLTSASQAELVELGMSAEEAAKVVQSRNAQYFRTYDDLSRAGLEAEAIEALRNSREINKRQLNTLSAEELVQRGGISQADAERILRFRSGISEFTPELLSEVLGDRSRGSELFEKSKALDLQEATVDKLVERGLHPRDAERLVRYARANALSQPTTPEAWEALFQKLREAKVIRGARRVRELSGRAAVESVTLEAATPESLVRFGLTEVEAKEVVRLRDTQPLTAESLVEGGFSEAEARRLAGLMTEVDPRKASYAELEARTGLDRAALERVVAVAGTNVAEASPEALAERFGITPAKAKKLVLLRDGMSFAEALEAIGHGDKLETLTDRAKGVTLGSESTSIAELARRLNIAPATARKIVRFRDAHDLNSARELQRAGLSQAEAERIFPLLGDGDALRVSEAPAELGLTAEEAKLLETARTAIEITRYTQLIEHGVDLSTMRALQNSSATLNDLKTLSAAELAEKANVSLERAKQVVRVTQVADVESLESLQELLGEQRGREVYTRAKVRRSSPQHELERAFGEEIARKLVNYREANRFTAYDLDSDLRKLREAGVVSDAVIEKIRLYAPAIDVKTVTLEELTGPRFQLPERVARRLIARRDSRGVDSVEELRKLGLTKTEANRVLEGAKPLNVETATVEELTRRGFSDTQARELVDLREKIGNAPKFDAQEVSKQLRYKVKKWALENELAEGLLRSLIPEARPGEIRFAKDLPTELVDAEVRESEARRGITEALTGEGEGFSNRRAREGSTSSPEVERGTAESIRSTFNAVRSSALARWEARLYALAEGADRAVFESGREALRNAELEIVRSNDVLAEVIDGKTVRVSVGLWNELQNRAPAGQNKTRFAIRGLALILGHELSHVGGVKVERPADIEGLRIARDSAVGESSGKFTRAEIRETLAAFDKPLGSSRVSNALYRMKNLVRYGRVRARVNALESAAEGKAEADPFSQYRRANGTVRWGQVARARTVGEIKGGAHFALALFFKEVATLVATGDKHQMEEFFDYLASTDFYKHYGLFVAGARIGEVAYVKSLQRHVKPKFVNSLLKTSLVLGAGIALPMIVEGTFEWKSFTITLGSLGLSSALVKGAVSGGKKIRGLMTIKEAQSAGKLARVGKLARFGGWVYTAVELGVVLIIAEEIEEVVHHYLDERAAKKALRESGERLLAATRDPNATPESVEAAARDYHETYGAWRNFLYAPIQAEEMWLAQRAEGMAEKAKEAEDNRREAITRIGRLPRLKAKILADHGSLEGYAAHLVAQDEAELSETMNGYLQTFNERREEGLHDVYHANKRGTPITPRLQGSALTALTAPAAGTAFSNMARPQEVRRFEEALGTPSKNRLESYGDESLILEQIEASLRGTQREELAEVIKTVRDLVGRTLVKDQQLISDKGQVDMSDAAGPESLPDVPRLPSDGEGDEAAEGEGTDGLVDVLPDYPAVVFLKSEGRVLSQAAQGSEELGAVAEGGAVFATGPAEGGFVPVEFDGKQGYLPAVQIQYLR